MAAGAKAGMSDASQTADKPGPFREMTVQCAESGLFVQTGNLAVFHDNPAINHTGDLLSVLFRGARAGEIHCPRCRKGTKHNGKKRTEFVFTTVRGIVGKGAHMIDVYVRGKINIYRAWPPE